jgi:hypothetical protein
MVWKRPTRGSAVDVRQVASGSGEVERGAKHFMLRTMLSRLCVASIAVGVSCSTASAATGSAAEPVQSTCQTTGTQAAAAYGATPALIAAFQVTAAQMAAWQERPATDGGPTITRSPWRTRPASQTVFVCYFDGAFTGFGKWAAPGPGEKAVNPNYDRLVIVIEGAGKTWPLIAGYRARLPVQDPARP